MVQILDKKLRLGVVGAGTAGIVTIAHLIPSLTNNWEVVSIYDPNTPILGIGESTNPNILIALQYGLGFNELTDLNELDATLKFGTKFINWRKNDWVNPLFGAGHAIHFNNFKLKDYAFKKLKELWPNKFQVLEGKVDSITNGFQCANVVVNGEIEKFDYVIDCRGFPEDFSNYHISDCSPLNKCFVHSVEPTTDISYQTTEHIATKHGWMFGIPLSSRHTYGYLFNDTITSDDDAVSDLNKTLSLNVKKEDLTVYTFKSYYSKQLLDGRILNNGNRALFFEPLSASSIFVYIEIAELFTTHLSNTTKYNSHFINAEFTKLATSLEDMLSFLYHGGSEFDSEFWKYAKNKAVTRLNNSQKFKKILKEYKNSYSIGTPYYGESWFFTPYSLRIIDEKMNYNYFK